MKVLFNTYASAFQTPGGGEVVLLKLKEHIERQSDIQIKLFNQWSDRFSDFDLIHEFTTFNWELWYLYAENNIPFVVTPTMNPNVSFKNRFKLSISHFLKQVSQLKMKPFCKHSALQFPYAFFPTTSLESERLVKLYKLNPNKMKVIPNGVDDFSKVTPAYPFDLPQDFVLFVANISPVKRLKELIIACKKLSLNLVVVGAAHVEHQLYYNECREIADANVLFLGKISNSSPELIGLYLKSRVVAVSSLFESCSLVGLEAGSLGKPIVMTNQGGTTEVFKDHVSYHDPSRADSLSLALEKAWSLNGHHLTIKDYIRSNFLWSHVANQMILNYRQLLE